MPSPLDLRILDAFRQVIAEFYGPQFGIGIKTFVLHGMACFTLLNLPVGRMNAVFDAFRRAELKERDRDIPAPSPVPIPWPGWPFPTAHPASTTTRTPGAGVGQVATASRGGKLARKG